MLKCGVLLVALLAAGLAGASADTIQLKDKASISGKVLAEKPDQVAVDLGYTILVVPRNQILKISKTATMASSTAPSPTPAIAASAPKDLLDSKPGFYWAPARPGPVRTVLELVKQIGEA